MLLDAETFDLVQHIDTVLAAVSGHELEPRINPELMQSVLEVATPVCRTPADVAEQLRGAARLRLRGRARARHARRLGRHPSVLALRAAAHHREGPVSRDGRSHAVHRAARADLRAARPRRGRRPREGDPGRERPDRPSRRARRAVRELAVLARRADRARLVAPHGVRRLAPLGPAAALPRTTPTTPRSSASSSARAASPTTRTSGGTSGCIPGSARSRSGSATRSRELDDVIALTALLPGARQALLGALRRRRGDRLVPPHPHHREQVARRALRPRGAGHGSRHRPPQPRSGCAAHPAHAEGDRAARARARLGARAGRHRRHPRAAATAPTASCASSTRTATSSRSCARSRT